MRFMVLVKASEDSEAGVMPSEELLTEMGKYNEELVKAGVMLAGEGLHPSSKGVRVRFNGREHTALLQPGWIQYPTGLGHDDEGSYTNDCSYFQHPTDGTGLRAPALRAAHDAIVSSDKVRRRQDSFRESKKKVTGRCNPT